MSFVYVLKSLEMKVGFSFDEDMPVSMMSNSDICRSGLNGFRKLRKIGFGTYGDIYMALHRSSGNFFALKSDHFD